MHGWHDTRISDRVTVTVKVKILSTDSSVVIDVEYIFSGTYNVLYTNVRENRKDIKDTDTIGHIRHVTKSMKKKHITTRKIIKMSKMTYIQTRRTTFKPAHELTSIKQSPVLKGQICLAPSEIISY
jgi:hypothetical protein